MCYGTYPVKKPGGGIAWIPREEFYRLYHDGKLRTREDGFHYAKDAVATLARLEREVVPVPMRWDLIPRDFLQKENLNLAETIRRKNSRAKESRGFSSYNARLETVASLWSFKRPWAEGKRCVVPASAFRERANMDEAPAEFRNREYNVQLNGEYFLAGIWDRWANGNGEAVDSCAILTLDSAGNEKLRGIWHERCPVILDASRAEEWLNSATSPEAAMKLCRLIGSGNMEIVPVPPKPGKTGKQGITPPDFRLPATPAQ